MKRVIFLCIFLLFPSLSFGKKVIYRKTQNVNFDEANIDGTARSPDGSYVHQKKGIKFLPLYRVKEKFDDEIKNSVEYLR